MLLRHSGFKASKTLSGIETLWSLLIRLLLKGFKASKTLSGIETWLRKNRGLT